MKSRSNSSVDHFLFYLPQLRILKANYRIKSRTPAIGGKATASSGPWVSPDIRQIFPEEPAVKIRLQIMKASS